MLLHCKNFFSCLLASRPCTVARRRDSLPRHRLTGQTGKGAIDGTEDAAERARHDHVVRLPRCNRVRVHLKSEVVAAITHGMSESSGPTTDRRTKARGHPSRLSALWPANGSRLEGVSQDCQPKRQYQWGKWDRQHRRHLEHDQDGANQTAGECIGKGHYRWQVDALQYLRRQQPHYPGEDSEDRPVHEHLNITAERNVFEEVWRAEPASGELQRDQNHTTEHANSNALVRDQRRNLP